MIVRFILSLLTIGSIATIGISQVYKDVVYATVANRNLLVDIYLPAKQSNPFLVIWIHGGAWHSGSKENPPKGFLENGYALASVDYRLSGEAPYPAMIHDIKASIRYLRANFRKYGYREDKMVIAGSSAGGHLAALVGTTNGETHLEGTVGAYLSTSSEVQAIIDLYGPTNFLTILNQSTPHGLNVRVPALKLLLGKPVEEVPDLAREASPVYQVDAEDPPIFIAHGDQDNQVPVNQSLELHGAYKGVNNFSQLEIVHGAGHGSPEYYTQEFTAKMLLFLKEALSR